MHPIKLLWVARPHRFSAAFVVVVVILFLLFLTRSCSIQPALHGGVVEKLLVAGGAYQASLPARRDSAFAGSSLPPPLLWLEKPSSPHYARRSKLFSYKYVAQLGPLERNTSVAPFAPCELQIKSHRGVSNTLKREKGKERREVHVPRCGLLGCDERSTAGLFGSVCDGPGNGVKLIILNSCRRCRAR